MDVFPNRLEPEPMTSRRPFDSVALGFAAHHSAAL